MGLQEQLASYPADDPNALVSQGPVAPGAPMPFAPIADDRNAQIVAQQEAADRPLSPPGGGGPTEADYAQGTPGMFPKAPPNPDAPLYDGSGKITESGRRELESHGAKVADVAPPPDKSPIVTGQPQGSQPPQPPPQRQDDGLMAMLQAQGRGGGGGGDPFKNRNASLQEQMRRADEIRDLRTDAGTFNAGESQKQASAMDRYSAEAKARGESQTKEAEGKEAAFVKSAEDSASDRINPNHYKETRGAFQAGVDMLGGIFGGLGQANGGPNGFIDQLNGKIASDISAQRSNHEIKAEGVKAKQTAYGMMLDKFGNQNVAAHAAHAGELEKWRALGDARAALDTNVDAQERWAIERGKIDHEIATNRDKAIAAGQAGGMSLEKMVELRNKILAGNKTQAETDRLNNPTGTPEESKEAANRTVMVNGQPQQAINTKAAQDYKEFADSAPDAHRAFDQLKTAWKNGDVGAYEAARGQLLDSLPKVMLGSNASGPTRAQAEETYGKLVPDYRHWYNHPLTQGRTDEAFGVVDNMMNQREQTLDETTFKPGTLQQQVSRSATPPPGFQGVGK